MTEGQKSHSGLHNLKRKKNKLADGITVIRQQLMGVHVDAALARMKQQYRAMHLADCYMRGRAYSLVEAKRHTQPIWDLVALYVDQNGGPIVQMPPLDEWALNNANA